jgi:two-component system nitrogen regulation response regulator GlnG
LRERSEDIPDLVRHFLGEAEREGLPRKSLDAAAMERLCAYRWPGNVRELENLVRRLAALYSEEVIGIDIVEAELAETAPEPGANSILPAVEAAPGDETLSQAVSRHLEAFFAGHPERLPPPGLYDRMLPEIERPLISLCLRATRGNQLKAAALLGLNRNTLRKQIRELDIEVMRGMK